MNQPLFILVLEIHVFHRNVINTKSNNDKQVNRYRMKHSDMYVRSFYKTEKHGENDYSNELYIHRVNLNVHINYPEYISC